jgi:hypothetical protein
VKRRFCQTKAATLAKRVAAFAVSGVIVTSAGARALLFFGAGTPVGTANALFAAFLGLIYVPSGRRHDHQDHGDKNHVFHTYLPNA